MRDVLQDMLDTDGNPINATLYKQFWSLQQVFQNPTKAIEPNLWVQVRPGLSCTAIPRQTLQLRHIECYCQKDSLLLLVYFARSSSC